EVGGVGRVLGGQIAVRMIAEAGPEGDRPRGRNRRDGLRRLDLTGAAAEDEGGGERSSAEAGERHGRHEGAPEFHASTAPGLPASTTQDLSVEIEALGSRTSEMAR